MMKATLMRANRSIHNPRAAGKRRATGMRTRLLVVALGVLVAVGSWPHRLEAQQETPSASQQSASQEIDAKASALEAQLNQLSDRSPQGAATLLELVDLYYEHGRVLGLIRVGQRFVTTQAAHPRHAEVMHKTFEGLASASRTDELVALGRQFVVRYSDHEAAGDVYEHLALVFDNLDRRADAAESLAGVWRSRGDSTTGRDALLQSIRKFGELNNRQSFHEAGTLAEEGFQKVRNKPFSLECGWQAFYWYRRAEEWAAANAVGQRLLRRGGELDESRVLRVHFEMGENYARLEQRANAIESYKEAAKLDPTSSAYHRLLSEMHHATAKPEDMAPHVREFLKKHADSGHRADVLGWFAHAYLRAEQNDQARRLFEDLLEDAPRNQDAARHFVRASRENQWDDTERKLRAAIGKTTAPYAVRYALAFDLYRDRREDENRAKAMALELLTKTPADDWQVREALHWVLWKTEDEGEFRQVVKQIEEAIDKHPWIVNYQDWLRDWGRDASKRREHADRGRIALDAYERGQKKPQIVAWRQTHDHRNTGARVSARDKLLEPKAFRDLPDRVAYSLASAQGYDLRHRVSSSDRPKSAAAYQQLAERFTKDDQAALWWLESATDHLKAEASVEAVGHLLKIQPEANYPDAWRRMIQVAKGLEDVSLAKKVLAWIEASQKKHGLELGSAATVGDRLWELELQDEALAYWKARWNLDHNHADARQCLERLLNRSERDEQIKLLTEALKEPSEHHGLYAQWLADRVIVTNEEEDLKADWKRFAELLKQARDRQDERPFRWWNLDGSWIRYRADEIRRSDTMSDDEKRLALGALSSLRVSSSRSVVEPIRWELGHYEDASPMDQQRLLGVATLLVGRGSGNFDTIRSFAQRAMSREDYPSAATLLTGMLTNIGSVDDNRRKQARDLLARCYSRMGGVGLAIDESSPLAPLLRAALYLRLGDTSMALETYNENRSLFDEHRNEVPVDLVLFVCETHIAAAGEANLDRAEDILRSWLIANEDSDDLDASTKASMQLLLGRLYYRAQRYDVARSEYTTVLNRYASTPEAIEAQFGIGESYMAQKVYDQAEDIFTKLATHNDRDVVIRAEFLRGVLAWRREDRDTARDIFRGVLEMVPSAELANQALFNLAEVYGSEQRYIDQLELLRTVGRLGRASKRWHTPGQTLSIVVQDSDLGISRGHARIPVQIRTEPGGDVETIYLISGGAGKGLFRADVPTQLGLASPGDGVLQITGADEILCDYPEEFKAEFRHVPLSDAQIRIGATGELFAASRPVVDQKQETLSERLEREALEADEANRPTSERRPEDQIKPGNLIYLRVKDPDRSLTDQPDEVFVKLEGSSGDSVQQRLVETGPHTGVFEGTAETGELPASAQASDSAIDHSPLMAIDQDLVSAWVSEPNGATPKWLSVDLKDLREVDYIEIETPDPTRQAPVRFDVQGSLDGVFWFTLASLPERDGIEPLPWESGRMTQHVFRSRISEAESWEKIHELIKNHEPSEKEVVDTLRWGVPEDHEDAEEAFVVLWHGKLVQPRAGAARLHIDADRALVVLDGHMVLAPTSGRKTSSVDVYLTEGAHEVTIVAATANGAKPVRCDWARQDYSTAKPPVVPFRATDFDLDQPFAKDAQVLAPPRMAPDEAGMGWEFYLDPLPLRHVRLMVHEYRGEAVAINHVVIAGPPPEDSTDRVVHIPTEVDILALADNDILEIAAGDAITATYSDRFTQNGEENRLLSATLKATYYDAKIEPIGYDFRRQSGASFQRLRKRLMRIDPGERIIVEVTDYDRDTTEAPDTITFTVQVNDGEPVTFTATETEPNSGVFTKEIDTIAPGTSAGRRLSGDEPAGDEPSAEAALQGNGTEPANRGKDEDQDDESTDPPIEVRPGDRVIITYLDEQNTFPGHAVPRETFVFVREPSEAQMRIVETRLTQPPEGSTARPAPVYLPAEEDAELARFTFEVPLTIEVFDPDAAKDDRSEVIVTLTTTDGASIPVRCVVSNALWADADNAQPLQALMEGRFVGQVALQLGGKNSPDIVPLTQNLPRNLVGGPVLPEDQAPRGGQTLITRVLNLTGRDMVTATYNDELHPDGEPVELATEGRLISTGQLACLDRDYRHEVTQVHVGERLYLQVIDPDLDISDKRDVAEVVITTPRGEREVVRLHETLAHSGVFTGSVLLKPSETPEPGNFDEKDPVIETYFGDTLTLTYHDANAGTPSGTLDVTLEIPVVVGTDGIVAAFAKTFRDETIAVETQFHIAEAYFELFKSHRQLGRAEEERVDLESGRRVLREVMEDYPDPKYVPRVAYLLAQFAQELKQWDEAISNYELIVRQYPEHTLAPDAQFKLAQCYEEAGDFDQALEEYVTLAATYPNNPLIANVMIRISEYFWKREQFPVAASVGEKFLERFEGHQWASRMAFRIGQSYYKDEDYKQAGAAFDRFLKTFPDDTLAADALFWAGESFRQGRDYPAAFHRYNRCRYEFPESDPAKFARGRLQLPEMISEFERAARVEP